MIAQESTEPPPPPPHSTENQLESVPSPFRSSSSSSPSSRLNAGAPEFVPRNTTPRLVLQPSSPLFHVPHQSYGVGVGSGKQPQTAANSDHVTPPPVRNNGGGSSGGGLSEDSRNKILNQVEYYFSDVNLATTDHLMKFISKDPDGYVPISVVVSFKKIKAFVSSCQQLATLLRKSSKLAVSDDGKKVKRQIPLTEADMEELQSRIVLAENLPEDHSYQNLMRVFSSVGSVKTIRTCQPQNGNGNAGTPRSKLDNNFLSNKFHAFVEYESVEIAEKAVNELNDVRNWRSGLKVRLMPKRSPSKSNSQGGRGRKFGEEDDLSTSEQVHLEDNLSSSADITFHEHSTSVEDKERRGRGGNNGTGRGGKGRGRSHRNHNNNNSNNNNIIGTPPSGEHLQLKPPPGPRMPDGTRGFALGRGKPLLPSSNV